MRAWARSWNWSRDATGALTQDLGCPIGPILNPALARRVRPIIAFQLKPPLSPMLRPRLRGRFAPQMAPRLGPNFYPILIPELSFRFTSGLGPGVEAQVTLRLTGGVTPPVTPPGSLEASRQENGRAISGRKRLTIRRASPAWSYQESPEANRPGIIRASSGESRAETLYAISDANLAGNRERTVWALSRSASDTGIWSSAQSYSGFDSAAFARPGMGLQVLLDIGWIIYKVTAFGIVFFAL